MRYEIVGKEGFEPTEAIKAYVKKRLRKIVDFFDREAIDVVVVTLQVYKDHSKVEVTIPAPYIVLRSEVRDPDMYAAIDKSVDKLSQQIRKHKTKIRSQYSKGGGVGEVFAPSFDDIKTEEPKAKKLVKSKKIAIKPMKVEEAITQMELLGHDFFIFLDIDKNEPQIVYRREDGDYAVIEAKPEFNM